MTQLQIDALLRVKAYITKNPHKYSQDQFGHLQPKVSRFCIAAWLDIQANGIQAHVKDWGDAWDRANAIIGKSVNSYVWLFSSEFKSMDSIGEFEDTEFSVRLRSARTDVARAEVACSAIDYYIQQNAS